MKSLKSKLLRGVSAASGAVLLVAGCAANSSDSLSNLTMSGTLSGSTSIVSHLALSPDFTRNLIRRAVSYSGYTISCSTISVPSTTVTGTVAADNSFSIALEKGVPYRCTLLSGSTVKATFVFSNSNKKSMSGDAQTVDSLALGSNATGLSLAVDTTSGQAVGDASSLSLSSDGLDEFNFTGTYTIKALGESLPTGYSDVCAVGAVNCNGPQADEVIYVKRIVGTSFTPNAQCLADLASANSTGLQFSPTGGSCGGTAGTDNVYGVAVWRNEASFNACGPKLGFTYDEGKARAQADLSASGIGSGAPTWDSTAPIQGGGTANLTEGWKATQATASWPLNNCVPVTAPNGDAAYKCTEVSGTDYSVNIGGGCVDSSSNPVQPNWSSVTWGGCTSTALTGTMTGFQRNVCTATQGANTYTCTNTWGTFASNGTATDSSNYNWNDTVIATQGTACSAISDTYALQKLQCYAQYYQNNINNRNSGTCLPDIRFNWTTTDSTKFVYQDGPMKAANQHVMAGGQYGANGTFTFRDGHSDWRGVRVSDSSGNNTWVNCRVKEVFTMTMKKINASDYMTVFVSENFLLSSDIVACSANQSQLGIGVSRAMFKMQGN